MKKLSLLLCLFLSLYSSAQLDSNQSRFQFLDFQVYYTAGQRVFQDSPIYNVASDGHFIYKYSPEFAWAMVPFTALPMPVAAVIFIVLQWILLIIALRKMDPLLNKHSYWIYFFVLIVFSKHLIKEIYLGQINILLLSLLMFSVLLPRVQAALSLATSFFIKPFGIFLVPWFIIDRKAKVLFDTALWMFIIVILLGIIYGFDSIFITLHREWIHTIQAELLTKSDSTNLDNQTLITFFSRVFHLSNTRSLIYAGIVYLIFWISFYRIPKISGLLILSLTPLLLATSNNFYVLSIPLYLIAYSFFPKFSLFQRTLVVLSSLLMVFNQYELFGRDGVDRIDFFCPYAISLVIMSGTLMWYFRPKTIRF